MRSWFNRRRFAVPIAWLAAVLAFAPASRAVVVLPKKSNQPVMGYLVRQDERTVIVRQPLADGKSREIPFSRSDIDELIITVSPERLSRLTRPGRRLTANMPRSWPKSSAIPKPAIWPGGSMQSPPPAEKAISARARCSASSPSPRRRRKNASFCAAAFLYDPEHDAAVLVNPLAAPPADAGV